MRSPLEAQTAPFSLLRSVRFFLYMHTLVQIKSPCLLLWQDVFLPGAGLWVWVHNAPVIGLGGYNGDRGTARNMESICRPSATLLWPQSRRTVLYEVLYSETQPQNSFDYPSVLKRVPTLFRDAPHYPHHFQPRAGLWLNSTSHYQICMVAKATQVPAPPLRVFFFFFFVSSPNTCSIN